MTRRFLLAITLLLLGGCGCPGVKILHIRYGQKDPHTRDALSHGLDAKITGLLISSPAFVDFVDFKKFLNIGAVTDTVPLKPNTYFFTQAIVKVKVYQVRRQQGRRTIYDYTALVGPHPNSKDAHHSFKARVENSEPTVHLDDDEGWIYAMGTRPVIRVQRVSAGADGTTILLEVDPKGPADVLARVYFIEQTGGESVTVTRDKGTLQQKSAELTQSGTYLNVPATGNFGCPKLISQSPTAKAFVVYVKAKAVAAQMP